MVQSERLAGFTRLMTAVPLQQHPRPMPFQRQPQPMVVPTDAPGSISGFQQLGYVVLVVYLFLIHSRVFDVKFGFLHIPGISYRIILVTMLLSRAFLVG